MFNRKRKIAIVYDWIDKWGGVERVLLHLHTLFPDAHFFTSAVNPKNAQWAQKLPITTSFMQSIPLYIRSNRAIITPLFPFAFESFRFDEYELVISVTSAFAKGIITKPSTKHICYLLTPPRYLWSHEDDYFKKSSHFFLQPAIDSLKRWDLLASKRPDGYISISHTTAARAKKYYGINSPVVHPPFDSDYWDKQKENMSCPNSAKSLPSYYLWVGRLEKYKNPELIIEVAKQNSSRTFIFVGVGSLSNALQKKASPNCHFLGLIPDNELSYLYSHAKAFIMPQNEDFGYVSLEAQYHNCPIIALRAGGALETVIEGPQGIFFNEQTTISLVSQLERFEQISYNLGHSTGLIQKSIKEKFGLKRFDAEFLYQLNTHITI